MKLTLLKKKLKTLQTLIALNLKTVILVRRVFFKRNEDIRVERKHEFRILERL